MVREIFNLGSLICAALLFALYAFQFEKAKRKKICLVKFTPEFG